MKQRTVKEKRCMVRKVDFKRYTERRKTHQRSILRNGCATVHEPMRSLGAVPGGARASPGACAARRERRENSSLSRKHDAIAVTKPGRDVTVTFALRIIIASIPRRSSAADRVSLVGVLAVCSQRAREYQRAPDIITPHVACEGSARVREGDKSHGGLGGSEKDGRDWAAKQEVDGRVGGTSKAVESVVATCGYPPVVTRTFVSGSRR